MRTKSREGTNRTRCPKEDAEGYPRIKLRALGPLASRVTTLVTVLPDPRVPDFQIPPARFPPFRLSTFLRNTGRTTKHTKGTNPSQVAHGTLGKHRNFPSPASVPSGWTSVTSVTTDWSAFARNPELLISRFTRLVSRLSGFPHPPPLPPRARVVLRDPCVPRVGLPHPGQRSDRHHTPQPGTDEHGPDFFRG